MTDKPSNEDMNKALFMNLVMMLTSSVMQQLGKLKNPLTDEVEINLEGAQVSIDMLLMIREKTRGNLADDEKRMLDEALSSLQMNYVQVANEKPAAKAEPRDKAPEPAPEAKKAETGEEDTDAGIKKESGSAPKYHKSYGG